MDFYLTTSASAFPCFENIGKFTRIYHDVMGVNLKFLRKK